MQQYVSAIVENNEFVNRCSYMAEKLYYSMGEVAEMFDVNPSLIRYWGTRFAALRPKRNKKGNRMFTSEDIETLKLIHHLVKERGMTLDGARKALSAERVVSRSEVSAEMELLERLQAVRAMLVQVRDSYGVDESEVVDPVADAELTTVPQKAADEEPVVENPVAVAEQMAEEPSVAEEQIADEKPQPKKSKSTKKDKKETSDMKPKQEKMEQKRESRKQKQSESNLFDASTDKPAERPLPFYEQTLF